MFKGKFKMNKKGILISACAFTLTVISIIGSISLINRDEKTDIVAYGDSYNANYNDYYAAIFEWISNAGFYSQKTNSSYVTRGETVHLLWQYAGYPSATSTVVFSDIFNPSLIEAVAWAQEKGITNGTSATTFSPDTPITRAQYVVMLWRYAGSPIVRKDSNESKNIVMFYDVNKDQYFYEAMRWALAYGIVDRTIGDYFNPYGSVNEEVLYTYLYRYHETIDNRVFIPTSVRSLYHDRTSIVISITHQKLLYYENGELKLSTNIVTGKPGHRTITGRFSLTTVAENLYLPKYGAHVDYWIGITNDGQYGIHDASWKYDAYGKPHFGGAIYNNVGSHGCINVPLDKERELYNMVKPIKSSVSVYIYN